MPDINSILESFDSPPTRHAMMVHWPIVLAVVGLALTVLAAILRSNKTCLWLAIACQAGFGAAAFATLTSGEGAGNAIKGALSTAAREVLAEHEEMADKIWFFAAGIVALLLLSAAVRGKGGTILAWTAVLASVAGVGWVSQTAHHGGELVYKYGVGVPRMQPFHAINDKEDDVAAGKAPPLSGGAGAVDADPEKVAFFLDEAYPILSDYCFNCHNASKVARDNSGLLDQTTRETLLKGGVSGPAIVVGKPEESLMVHRLRGEDPDLDPMPPDGPLTAKEIAVIEKWIRDGAVWVDPAGAP